MGVYLSTPRTEKLSENGENERLKFGLSSMQGWRASMEDAHSALLDLDTETAFFGVFDGHGGDDLPLSSDDTDKCGQWEIYTDEGWIPYWYSQI